jgi:hypothetical protein
MRNNDSPPQMTVREERAVLMPDAPPADTSNARTPFGTTSPPRRAAGIFTVASAPAVPGASARPTTEIASDTRTVSNAGHGSRIGPQPTRPATRSGDLKYGITPATRGKGESDGGTR